MHTVLQTYRLTDLHAYLPAYILKTHILTYLHTYIPSYLRTYIHTYVHTYIYMYIDILTYTDAHSFSLSLLVESERPLRKNPEDLLRALSPKPSAHPWFAARRSWRIRSRFSASSVSITGRPLVLGADMGLGVKGC